MRFSDRLKSSRHGNFNTWDIFFRWFRPGPLPCSGLYRRPLPQRGARGACVLLKKGESFSTLFSVPSLSRPCATPSLPGATQNPTCQSGVPINQRATDPPNTNRNSYVSTRSSAVDLLLFYKLPGPTCLIFGTTQEVWRRSGGWGGWHVGLTLCTGTTPKSPSVVRLSQFSSWFKRS